MTSRSKTLLTSTVLSTAVLSLAAAASGWVRPDALRAYSMRDQLPSPAEPARTAALIATIDPETGELTGGAMPVELLLDPEIREALRQDSEDLKQVFHPDGSVSIDLLGRFQSATVARIDGTGRVLICSEHADGIRRALQTPGVSPKTAEVK